MLGRGTLGTEVAEQVSSVALSISVSSIRPVYLKPGAR